MTATRTVTMTTEMMTRISRVNQRSWLPRNSQLRRRNSPRRLLRRPKAKMFRRSSNSQSRFRSKLPEPKEERAQ